ncbi:MAG: PD40 domain-containing protein, partial [Candidatus Eremiobacteraeota bacterium]|nr:PD40 domain-containing protein [Candidatus Eremiobacteraeota bacterium]
ATRIVDGHGAPTGPVTVAGTALATPTTSLAQIVDVPQAFSASAVDLSLTGLTRTAQLGLDLRADLDGKPDGTSLLGGPVQFTLQSTPNPTPAWVTVPLASAFHFANAGPARYWIVLQSLEGQVTWNTAPAAVTTASLPPLQQTTDGGLSWRATALSTGAATQNAPFTTLYRFRYLPDTYQIPIELQVGSGDAMTRVKLDRFAPLSRVDFTLDVPEVADGFNTYLGKATPSTCSQAEHLANGDFRQWQRLGTNLGAVNAVGTISPTGPLMFTADGQYLYVGASTNSGAEIDAVEVLRDLDVHRSTTLGGTSPALFGALSPDGTRAYLGTATALHVVDMTGRSELGTVPGLTVATTAFAAVSPDGATLYLAGTSGVQAYTTASLDDALRTQTPATATSSTTAAAAAGIALSPDGTRLYIADDGAGNGAKLTELDAVSLHAISTLALGKTLAGIAVTPDGKRVVVVDAATPTLFVVDAVAMDVVGTVALGANNPRAVALAPDGTQAYVVADDALGGHWLTVIDPSRLSIIGAPVAFGGATGSDVGGAITTLTLAAAPSGTRLYLADASAGTLASMSIGTLVPADWTPSGTVQLSPVATASPVVLLGDLPSKTSGSVPNDASISQVVPVAGGCGYIFSFQAVAAGVVQPHTTTTTAAKPDATAEVFWLDGQCGLAKTDTIPIAGVRGRRLTAYRTALSAPTGAVQAEVRFRATAGTLAEVGTASLAGSTDTVTNGDLQQIGSDGVPTGWTVSPSGARVAVSASPAAAVNASSTSTVRVRNPGTQAVELTQTVDLSNNPASVQLACDARTSATSASASTTPALAIDFAGSDGTALGTTTSIALAPGDFDQHPAELAVPAQAAHATVRLQLPPSAAVDVRTLTLSPVNRVNVPVAFVAQSPGELRVSNAVVAYERVPLPPPPVPANGLCTPTPANRTPGDGCAAEGGCWCTCCNAKRMMQRTTATTTPAGRPAMVGTCTTCGTTMLAVGGTVAGRPTVTAIPTLLVPSSPKGTVVGIMSPRQVPQLTDVPGIGATRASALTAAGITSVDALARAKPEMIANTLRGVTAANAEVIVKNAQRLSATANQ